MARCRDCTARIATHIDAVNMNVVQTSVSTSAPKYGMGAKSAVIAAAASATPSPLMRFAIAYTNRHTATKSAVCANATGSWPVPATL